MLKFEFDYVLGYLDCYRYMILCNMGVVEFIFIGHKMQRTYKFTFAI